MGAHGGPTTKQVADDIADLSSKDYTTFDSGGTTFYLWSYTSSGVFSSSYDPLVDVLMVAGGGSGGGRHGGGGGAGGILWMENAMISESSSTITIGAGGGQVGGNGVVGNDGSATHFIGETADGGGGGSDVVDLTAGDKLLNLGLNGVIKLVAVVAEKLDAVVMVGVV